VKQLLLVIACSILAATAAGQTADEKKATVAYLQGLQTSEGGFRTDPKAKEATLRGTSSALRAIHHFGGKVPDKALEVCKKFVLSCHDDKTGGFANRPGGKPDVVVTAVGLMALVELKVPTEKYEKKAIAYMADNAKGFEQVRMAAAGLEAVGKTSDKNRDWLARLARQSNENGTFGKGKALARDTGGAVACVLRLGGKVKEPKPIIKALDAEQRTDGGFGREDATGSDLETTYRVLRTYHMLKSKPARVDDMRKLVAKCRNDDGGYGVAPGLPSSVGGAYFAGTILHWLDEK
jgi:prenyltransferase beta subunit